LAEGNPHQKKKQNPGSKADGALPHLRILQPTKRTGKLLALFLQNQLLITTRSTLTKFQLFSLFRQTDLIATKFKTYEF
jgi:hypothetical protein